MNAKIKDIAEIIWDDSYIMIGCKNENYEFKTVFGGYVGEIPEKYLNMEFECILPMIDYGTPTIGIQLKTRGNKYMNLGRALYLLGRSLGELIYNSEYDSDEMKEWVKNEFQMTEDELDELGIN